MGINVLLYDENDMKAYFGEIVSVQDIAGCHPVDVSGNDCKYIHRVNRTVTAEIDLKEELFELSPSMMMRIRRYNQGKKCDDILKKIVDAKKELERLEDEINAKRERLKKIQEITESIWHGDSGEEYDDSMDW